LAIVAGLTILALIAPAPWHAKLGFCLVTAWQGNGESNFRQNLEILEEVSGLPVTRG
jgi:hypothetical protein